MTGSHQNAEAYSDETFRCGTCNREFTAKVATWVDASRTPQVKKELMHWSFNVVTCPYCGYQQFAETPFFYEDFEEGLLVAVFPKIPDDRGSVEASIMEKYGYYPVLEFFYDMTQLWTLLYLQNHYRANKNLRKLSRIGQGEARLRKMLRFLKEDPMMIEIRSKLTDSLLGELSDDALMDVLSRAVYVIEEMLPWPMDRRCICGGDLMRGFVCCGKPVPMDEHDRLLSPHYVVYCTSCGEALAGGSCEDCGRVYTWKLGTVPTYHDKKQLSAGHAPDVVSNVPTESQDH